MPSQLDVDKIRHTNGTDALTFDSSGNTNLQKDLKFSSTAAIKNSAGNNILSESGGNVTIQNVRLPANGGISDSSGNPILTESSGIVTVAGGVPVGAVIPFASVNVPSGFVICNGAEYSRTTYANLFSFLSFTDATCDTNSNTTVTMDSTALIGAGFGVSGAGIPAGTTVASVTNSTTFVLSQAVTATASNVTLTFTRWGVGTSDSNFRVPDFRGEFLRGHDGGRGADPDAATRTGGDLVGSSQAHDVQTHVHSYTFFNNFSSGLGGGGSGIPFYQYTTTTGGVANPGNETRPRNLAVQYCIKF